MSKFTDNEYGVDTTVRGWIGKGLSCVSSGFGSGGVSMDLIHPPHSAVTYEMNEARWNSWERWVG